MERTEFMAMVEKKLAECGDVNNAPFGMDGDQSRCYLMGKEAALQWVLEMLPGVDTRPAGYRVTWDKDGKRVVTPLADGQLEEGK